MIAPWASPPLLFAEVCVDLVLQGHDHIDQVRGRGEPRVSVIPIRSRLTHAGMDLCTRPSYSTSGCVHLAGCDQPAKTDQPCEEQGEANHR